MVRVSGELDSLARGGEIDKDSWLSVLPVALTETDRVLLGKAWEAAVRGYGERLRKSGETYFEHALAVTGIVGKLGLDADTVAAALLHDLPHHQEADRKALEAEFGPEVTGLVEGVSRMDLIDDLHEQSSAFMGEAARAEALRKMLLGMASDVRVVFIKLAERLHDLRTLQGLSPEERRRFAKETMEIYAPLANRLGIWQIKWEMEDLGFRYLEPDDYKRIAKLLDEKRVAREAYIERVKGQLASALDEAGIKAELSGRPKHLYSIWRKMTRKGLDIGELFDLRAVRILVNDIAACYAALGVVHGLWRHIPKEFDDYIATPKANNYRSLHTAVIGPEGRTLEIQIRTRRMHQEAELGIAAHWQYKEGARHDVDFQQKIAWLRQILEWGREESGAEAFVDRFSAEVFEDRVYVVTPGGDIVDLPRGATPLDFAYHIHSAIGHRCRGAKVGGRIVPLTYGLQTGEQVEILTARNGTPSRDWLNPHLGYLRTPRARSKVRAWFKQQDHDKNIALGRNVLDRELHRLNLHDVNLERLAQKTRFPKTDEFLAALGRGDITAGQIAGLLTSVPAGRAELRDIPSVAPESPGRASGDVTIEGVDNLLTRLARCCKPAPGDSIVGFITRGHGVTVHRRDCPTIKRLLDDHSPRLVDVDWNALGERRYPVDLVVRASDSDGLLKEISAILTHEKVPLLAFSGATAAGRRAGPVTLTLEIADIPQLSRVMDRIGALGTVLNVQRRV